MKLSILLLMLLAMTSCFNKENKKAALEINEKTTELNKIAYSIGAQYGKSLSEIELDAKAQEYLVQGYKDYNSGKLKLTNNDIQYLAKKVDGIVSQKRAESAKSEKEKGQIFITNLLNEDKEFKSTTTGLIYKVIKKGKKVAVKDRAPFVSMHFESFHLDEKQIESTSSGNPRVMPLFGIFKAWQEAFALVGVGGEVEIISPPELTYGDNGASPYIAPGEYLKFKLKFTKYHKERP